MDCIKKVIQVGMYFVFKKTENTWGARKQIKMNAKKIFLEKEALYSSKLMSSLIQYLNSYIFNHIIVSKHRNKLHINLETRKT